MPSRSTTLVTAPLLEKQQGLLTVLESMYDGVLICDPKTNVLWVNRAMRSAWRAGVDPTGLSITDALGSMGTIELMQLIETVSQSGRSQAAEVQMILGKSLKSFLVHGLPLPAVEGVLLVFHDTTEIRHTEKMRRDFVANVSHELRTPLSAIKGYAETLLDGALEDKEVAGDFIAVIYKHAQRLSQLVEDLLDLSKLESPDFAPELKPVMLMPLIQRVAGLILDKASENEILLTAVPPENASVAVMSDDLGLEQVITNLLDNAIKYTPVQGTVTISYHRRDDGFVQVDVTDTGIGIEAKHIPRLFERFYRVDKARSRDMGGTGLGLSIVKHIVQLHGGQIWVESTPGVGSTFSFILPVVKKP